MISELDKSCPRCKTANPGWSSDIKKSNIKTTSSVVAEKEKTVTTANTAVKTADNGDKLSTAIYTQCAWQRPDGRWLSSKEIAEIEQLAHKYVIVKGSDGNVGLSKIASMIGFKRSGNDNPHIDKIRKRVDEIGIPFGVFQAYANSLR